MLEKRKKDYIMFYKITKRKILFFILISLLIFVIGFFTKGVLDYLAFIRAVEASGSMPDTNAGKILVYQPGCTETCSGKCCCAVCDGFCAGHDMILYIPQITKSSTDGSLCVPTGFQYKGGGVIPKPGDDIIYGGIAPRGQMIKVIGIPGVAASSIKNVVNSFKATYDFIIAGFKN